MSPPPDPSTAGPVTAHVVSDAGAVAGHARGAADGFRHHGDTLKYSGYVWDVVVGDYESPDGERFRRDIVRSPGAVGIVPLLADGDAPPEVVLVAQYRPPYDEAVIEIPAGVRDVVDEPVEETARRELVEEAGLAAGTIEPLTNMYPSPGMTDSITSIVLATHCRRVDRDVHGPEERHMQVVQIPLATALEMVDRGEIVDAKTVVGLLMAERRFRERR